MKIFAKKMWVLVGVLLLVACGGNAPEVVNEAAREDAVAQSNEGEVVEFDSIREEVTEEVEAEAAYEEEPVEEEAADEQYYETETLAEESVVVIEVQPTLVPQGEEPDDMFFEGENVNPFIDTRDDNLSTFAIDVDTGSYSLMRRYMSDNLLPPSDAVRVEEFVNYFDHQYPLPGEDAFGIHLEAAPAPYGENENYHLVRVGIQGYDVPEDQRPPAMLIFVVDVSGSMSQDNRIGLVKESLHILIDNLDKDDQVGLVTYDSTPQVILEPTFISDAYSIHQAIDRLSIGGSTNMDGGLAVAYDLADQYAIPGGINRLIVASDGVGNVGATTADSILRHAREGIQLSTFGYGMGNYSDVNMEQLADQGDGSYAYIDSIDEAERVFEDQLMSTILTIAKDAKIQVEFNPAVIETYRLLGYENRDVADSDFRNDAVDAGEIGAGHSVTALYEVRFAEEANPNEVAMTVRVRYEDPNRCGSGGDCAKFGRP